MRLLFNKDEADFRQEIKEALGFIDADFPFIKMKSDLRTATSNIIGVIGKETYLILEKIYYDEAGTPVEATEGDNLRLLELAQYAVATAAYRLFAPANDLMHGTNGRKMLTDEDSKTPFEHMLVASNDELERRSFRAMDDLISLLDEISADWRNSDSYKASHRLLVRTTADFDRYHMISSRLLLLKLQPDLEFIEKREILPRLGKGALATLKLKVSQDDTLDAQQLELLPLIQEACVNGALSRGVIRLQGTLFPEGLLQKTRGDRTTVKGRVAFLGNQVDQASQFFKQTAGQVYKEIEAVIDSYKPAPTIEQEQIDESEISCDENDKFFS